MDKAAEESSEIESTPQQNTPDVDLDGSQEPATPQNETKSPYPPSTVVLAKVKGYPPWPAMVLEESILPQNIIQKKPKSNRARGGSRKGKSQPAQVVPVRFFSDDTYIWISSNDMKLLTPEQIQAHFEGSSNKRRKDGMLENAYVLAENPPAMDLFVKYGSKAVPDEPDWFEEEEEQEEVEVSEEGEIEVQAEEPVKKKTKKGVKQAVKQAVKKEPAKLSKTEERKLEQQKKRNAELKLLAEYDSDWGLDEGNEYDKDDGNYIFDTEKEQQSVFEEVQSAAEIQEELAEAHHEFSAVEDDLVAELLNDDGPNDKLVLKKLAEFKKMIDTIPRTVITKSRLLRALIVTARKPDFGSPPVVKEIHKSLEALGLNVRANLEEEIAPEEEVKQETEEKAGEENEDAKEKPDIKTEPNGSHSEEAHSNGELEPKPEMVSETSRL